MQDQPQTLFTKIMSALVLLAILGFMASLLFWIVLGNIRVIMTMDRYDVIGAVIVIGGIYALCKYLEWSDKPKGHHDAE